MTICTQCAQIIEEDYTSNLLPDLDIFLESPSLLGPRHGHPAQGKPPLNFAHRLVYSQRVKLDLRISLAGLLASLSIPTDPLVEQALQVLDRAVQAGLSPLGGTKAAASFSPLCTLPPGGRCPSP